MKQSERIASLARRIDRLEQIVADLCEDALSDEDQGPREDMDGNPIPPRKPSGQHETL